jgi:hypothetical protein
VCPCPAPTACSDHFRCPFPRQVGPAIESAGDYADFAAFLHGDSLPVDPYGSCRFVIGPSDVQGSEPIGRSVPRAFESGLILLQCYSSGCDSRPWHVEWSSRANQSSHS